jgi:hypothetical protein
MRALALALVLTSLGCAQDLSGWKVATTPHFRLYTDLRRSTYQPVLEHLEEVHAGLSFALFSAVQIPPMEVFLFDENEFHTLLGPIGGAFIGGVGKSGVLVVYDGYSRVFLDQTAAHELTHGFVHARWGAPPMWFNEGYATYAESIVVRQGDVLFGSHHVAIENDAALNRIVKVSELFSAKPGDFHGDAEVRYYVTAWALVHYLWLGENKSLRRRFEQFAEALAHPTSGPGNRSARAWEAVYPEVPVADLDERIAQHLSDTFFKQRDAVVGYRMPRPDAPELSLAPADMSYVNNVRDALKTIRRPDRF